jgi:PII-like signaling protein|tara:strand:+ start:5241 stop:5405 length:165 start_codon:yes stop_codon:yes gene_type:complete
MTYDDVSLKITVLSMYSDQEDSLEKAKAAFEWVMEELEVIKPEGATVTKLEPVQ